jgi:hypothetical protein
MAPECKRFLRSRLINPATAFNGEPFRMLGQLQKFSEYAKLLTRVWLEVSRSGYVRIRHGDRQWRKLMRVPKLEADEALAPLERVKHEHIETGFKDEASALAALLIERLEGSFPVIKLCDATELMICETVASKSAVQWGIPFTAVVAAVRETIGSTKLLHGKEMPAIRMLKCGWRRQRPTLKLWAYGLSMSGACLHQPLRANRAQHTCGGN